MYVTCGLLGASVATCTYTIKFEGRLQYTYVHTRRRSVPAHHFSHVGPTHGAASAPSGATYSAGVYSAGGGRGAAGAGGAAWLAAGAA